MQSLKLTVYEVLGYLAPGLVMLLTVLVGGWAAFYPDARLPLAKYSFGIEQWGLLIFIAYTLGHLVQGLCNFHPNAEKRHATNSSSVKLLENARSVLASKCNTDFTNYSMEQMSSFCQTVLLYNGKIEDHDVFLYREGYYRGSSAAFLLLSVAVFLRLARGAAIISIATQTYSLSSALLISTALCCDVVGFIFYRRYIRFGDYRVRNLLNCACMPLKQDAASAGHQEDKNPSAE